MRVVTFIAAILFCATAGAQTTLSRGDTLGVDTAVDGRLAIDLRGDIWVVPGGGGDALQLTQNLRSAQQPRWSPDGERIAFQATVNGEQGLWQVDVDSGSIERIGDGIQLRTQPDWHPDGERVTYSAAANGSGFDLWDVDLLTGIRWRLTQQAGDETDADWSADGRDLVYVHHDKDTWSLILRRRNLAEEVLLRSREKLSSPSWRPDGSLIVYFEQHADKTILKMVILSHPRLVRTYSDRENFDGTRVSWLDRQRMVYSANGFLRTRTFGAWTSQMLPFQAYFAPPVVVRRNRPRPVLDWHDEPQGQLTIHAARFVDGLHGDYQYNKDIVIRGGRIAAIVDHGQHEGIAIDMGDLTVLPGFIDADARLPVQLSASHGPDLLTMGITTIAAPTMPAADADILNRLWSGKSVPGPRILGGSDWTIDSPAPLDLDVTAAVSTSRATGAHGGRSLTGANTCNGRCRIDG